MIQVGQTYQHYKGKIYKIIALAHYSENPSEILVIYQAQYDCPTFGKNPIWARPISMFQEMIFKNGQEQPRFTRV